MSTANPAHTNRLAREKSPYLLQHQHNPVDWHPWGQEAFAKARAEDKPIFLSIGYATCHWCHVMERESFENATVAAFLNDHFVSIKVDREERPDVDRVYMTAVQALTGQGGWPLSAFLSPDLKPFYGGTYFPPENRHSLPGFLTVLQQISQFWSHRRAELTRSAEELHRRLTHAVKAHPTQETVLTQGLLHEAATRFTDEFDAKEGGFGEAPKFPRPAVPMLLLRYGTQYLDQDAIDMVLFTCERMAAGGIHDQLGGGFARYAVDTQWRVPHFEKMLYDNAQLAHLYLEAFQASGQERFARVTRGIFDYVRRDMTHPEGGCYSAEDADSEGKEGKFYCWTREELAQRLSPAEFQVAERCFGVTAAGNFVDHSDPHPLLHQNVLSLRAAPTTGEDTALLEAAKKKLFAARRQRVRPFLDDKILTSWNGLMLGALARGYAILEDESLRAAAEKNFAFLRAKLWDAPAKRFFSRWREGETDTVRLLDASAFALLGLLDLYEATLEPAVLAFAVEVADAMIEEFYDPASGGFWQSAPKTDHLVLRIKDDYDGAEPSGNSTAVLGLLRLHALTRRAPYRQAAEQTLRWLAPRLEKLPQAVPFGLIALLYYLEEPVRIVLTGDPRSPGASRLRHAAHKVFIPNKIILGTQGDVDPFARTLEKSSGAPAAYLCRGNSCQLPIHSAEILQQQLAAQTHG